MESGWLPVELVYEVVGHLRALEDVVRFGRACRGYRAVVEYVLSSRLDAIEQGRFVVVADFVAAFLSCRCGGRL